MAKMQERLRLRCRFGIPDSRALTVRPSARGDAFGIHRRIACLLSDAGFDVRSVERLDTHPVWRVNLRRGSVPRASVTRAVCDIVGGFLRPEGVVYPGRDDGPVIIGDRITVGFILESGATGKLSYSRGVETVFLPGHNN